MITDPTATQQPDPLDNKTTETINPTPALTMREKPIGKKPKRKIGKGSKSLTLSSTSTTNTTLQAPIDDQALAIAIAERGKNLTRLVDTILSKQLPRVRAGVAGFLELLADGCCWTDAIGITKVSGPQFNGFLRQHPPLFSLLNAAKESGEASRRVKREETAHKHAVEGTERPVYQQGALVGTIREFDHRLLEFLLKADNPSKYREQATAINIQNNVVSTVVKFHKTRQNKGNGPTETINVENAKENA